MEARRRPELQNGTVKQSKAGNQRCLDLTWVHAWKTWKAIMPPLLTWRMNTKACRPRPFLLPKQARDKINERKQEQDIARAQGPCLWCTSS